MLVDAPSFAEELQKITEKCLINSIVSKMSTKSRRSLEQDYLSPNLQANQCTLI